MATIHTASDLGFYNGSLININPHSGDILWIIKSALKTAGWTITDSGDGNLVSGVGDLLTNNSRNNGSNGNSPKIANSICNDGCWFIARTPVGAPQPGEVCIQLVSYALGSPSLRVKWAEGGFTASYLPSFTPPATAGQQLVLGGGTDGAPTGTAILPSGYAEYSARFNMGIDDAAATPRFWSVMWENGSRHNIYWQFFVEFLTGLKAPDVNPYVCAWPVGVFLAPFTKLSDYALSDTTVGEGVCGRFGTTLTHKLAAMAPGLILNDVTSSPYVHSLVRALGKSSVSGKECGFPVAYARHTTLANPKGLKGFGSYLHWAMVDKNLGDHINVVSPKDYVYIGDFFVPWTSSEKCIP